jgi:hypothetical protein
MPYGFIEGARLPVLLRQRKRAEEELRIVPLEWRLVHLVLKRELTETALRVGIAQENLEAHRCKHRRGVERVSGAANACLLRKETDDLRVGKSEPWMVQVRRSLHLGA